jgi:hypothetical protein
MQILNVTNLPIYLPYDKAAVPFGDPLEGVTCTSASPGVVTAPGYAPTNGDAVQFTFLAGGSMPTGLTAATTYYVVAASGNTFEVAATKGGAAINTSSTGASLVLHLLSQQVDGVTLPFKPGYTVLVENNSGGTLVLQGAADTNVAAPGQGYNPPGGPGTWNTLVSLTTGAQALVQLSYDWIRVSTAGTLTLQQN